MKLVLPMEILFRRHILMGGELSTETSIGLLVRCSAMCPPVFASIGNDDFIFSFFLFKVGVFEFLPISRRYRAEKEECPNLHLYLRTK